MTGCRIGKIKPKNGGATITILKQQNAYKDSTMIEMLIAWLAQARAGEFESIGIVGVNKDGTQTWNFAMNEWKNAHALIGTLEALQLKIITESTE